MMELLNKLNACQDAKLWSAGKTLSQARQECQRADWMLWLLGRSQINKKIIATIAVECAESCAHNAKDYPAVAECIAVVKRFLAGEATQDELLAARSAAWGAAELAAWAAARAAAWWAESTAWAAEGAVNCEIIRKHVSADEICKLFRKDKAIALLNQEERKDGAK